MFYQYNATVVRVVDGDTVDLTVDLGFRCHRRDRFRLYGIDAPERGQDGWLRSKAALEGMLPVGLKIEIQTEHPTIRDPADKYGRWIAVIIGRTAEGEIYSINTEMVKQGFAQQASY